MVERELTFSPKQRNFSSSIDKGKERTILLVSCSSKRSPDWQPPRSTLDDGAAGVEVEIAPSYPSIRNRYG